MNLSHVSNSQKPVLIERRLKSWQISYNFKWNQSYLTPGLNLSRGSNSLNLASVFAIHSVLELLIIFSDLSIRESSKINYVYYNLKFPFFVEILDRKYVWVSFTLFLLNW